MQRSGLRHIAMGLFVLVLISSIGCANMKQKRAVKSIAATRIELVKAQNDLTDTLKALDGLQNATGDLRPAYAQFKTALASTDRQAKMASERAVDMRENAAEYQKKWEEEMSTINNPELKSSAEERLSHMRDRYDAVREIALDCRQKYAVLHSDLLDINRYLSTELNAGSLEKAKPVIATARQHGDAVSGRLSELIEKMNQLTAEMNPTGKVPER